MTGFGMGRAGDARLSLSVELRSLNSKNLDLRIALPREFSALEERLERLLAGTLQRGRVDLKLHLEPGAGGGRRPRLNRELARAYGDVYRPLAEELGAPLSAVFPLIAAAPGVLEVEPGPSADELWPSVETALNAALKELLAMRANEGTRLTLALRALLGELAGQLRSIEAEIPASQSTRKERFLARVAELSPGTGVDPVRLAQECALLIDRSDVSEELARLAAHLEHFEELLGLDEAIGRRLDFLLQELHREANTLGAKVQSARISHVVIELKSVLERLREQVQNLE